MKHRAHRSPTGSYARNVAGGLAPLAAVAALALLVVLLGASFSLPV